MWPHQNTMILLIAFLLKHFELVQTFYILYYLIILFYVLTILFLHKTMQLLFEWKYMTAIQGVMLVFYFPYAFLVTNLYGDHIGYGFSMMAVYFCIKYLKYRETKNVVWMGICIALGICFKQNCMIILAGMVCILCVDVVHQGRIQWKRLLWVVLFLAGVGILCSLPKQYISAVSGLELGEGNSKLAHIAMGLQDTGRAPGWCNDYNIDVFVENNYSKAATAEASLENIKASLNDFITHPLKAWSFFHRKWALEWNNPTFECFNAQNLRISVVELSSLIKSTINDGGKVNILAIAWMDGWQTVLLFGMLLYLICAKDADVKTLLPAICFIGAFLFWTFWEAKPRYVVPYFLFMIPYSFAGYKFFVEKHRSKKFQIGIGGLFALVMVL